MPALQPLSPPIAVRLTEDEHPVDLQAWEAGRSDAGLRATVRIVNGRLNHRAIVTFPNADDCQRFVAAAIGCVPVDEEVIHEGLARLWDEVEAAVRTNEVRPARSLTVPDDPEFEMSDLGNARRFAEQWHGQVHYCAKLGWLLYNDIAWAVDEQLAHVERAKETARGIIAEAHGEEDIDRRMKLLRHAAASQSGRAIREMVNLARSDPTIATNVDDLDLRPGMINCQNGFLDLATGELLDHAPDHLCTKVLNAAYDPEATCPLWEQFMRDIMGGNREMIAFLQRAVGSALMGDPVDRILVMLYGVGRNGKSTFLETIQAILNDYARTTPMDALMERRNQGISNDVAALRGTRFVAASEGEEGARLNSALVKRLTGNDTITARFLHHEYFQFKPTFVLFVATNHKPVIRDTTDSIWTRVKLVPFAVQFREPPRPDDDPIPEGFDDLTPYVDREMPKRLLAERDGIFTWMVEGCQQWLADGLREPEEVRTATAEYRATQDMIAQWLEECTDRRGGALTPFKGLRQCYEAWCDEMGEHAITGRDFGQRLAERGYHPHTGTGGRKERSGIVIRTSAPGGQAPGGWPEAR